MDFKLTQSHNESERSTRKIVHYICLLCQLLQEKFAFFIKTY